MDYSLLKNGIHTGMMGYASKSFLAQKFDSEWLKFYQHSYANTKEGVNYFQIYYSKLQNY